MKFESGADSTPEVFRAIEAKTVTDVEPPKFERVNVEGKDALPPRMERSNLSFGGSVELSARKTETERENYPKESAGILPEDVLNSLMRSRREYLEKRHGKK